MEAFSKLEVPFFQIILACVKVTNEARLYSGNDREGGAALLGKFIPSGFESCSHAVVAVCHCFRLALEDTISQFPAPATMPDTRCCDFLPG